MSRATRRIATLLAPDSPLISRVELAAELTPRAQSGSPIDKDALLAEIDAIIADIPTMTTAQLKVTLVKLFKALRYGLRRL